MSTFSLVRLHVCFCQVQNVPKLTVGHTAGTDSAPKLHGWKTARKRGDRRGKGKAKWKMKNEGKGRRIFSVWLFNTAFSAWVQSPVVHIFYLYFLSTLVTTCEINYYLRS